jgi:16S rRNA (guanine527-N7)-methyltransferase
MQAETSRRLRELAGRYALSGDQQRKLAGLLEVLARGGRAPTAVRRPEEAIDQHVADSLVALEVEALRSAGQVADIGSGAGFPGIPLAIALAGSSASLVESQSRWAAYLRALLSELGVANASVVHSRIEEWRAGIGAHDAVVARALAPQPVVLEYAAPLLRLGGSLIDWRGRRSEEEESQAQAAAEELGLRRTEVRKASAFEGVEGRYLHLYLKVSKTPPAFPRRPGVARRKPLGSSPRG